MPDPRLEAIRERLAKATPGSWTRHPMDSYIAVRDCHNRKIAHVVDVKQWANNQRIEDGMNDSDLIAHAPDDLRFLLTALDERTQELEKCKNDRDSLVSEADDLNYKLCQVKGEWPASDGSPMGIAQEKIKALQARVTQLVTDLQKANEITATYQRQNNLLVPEVSRLKAILKEHEEMWR